MRRCVSAAVAVAAVFCAVPAAASTAPARLGVDVAPGAPVPSDASFAIVQVTNGKGFTTNDHLAAQYAAAAALGSDPQLYLVGAQPGSGSPNWPKGPCTRSASTTCARDYGVALAQNALAYADGQLPLARVVWWIDVEDTATWVGPADQNLAAINGMAEALLGRSDRVASVGIYSNRRQWSEIAGSGTVHALVWSASPTADEPTAAGNCGPMAAFITGPVVLTQYARGTPGVSGDVECPPVLATPRSVLTGSTLIITGSAFPGRTIAVILRSGATTTTRTVTAASTGGFELRVRARYTTTVTATDVAGTVVRTTVVRPVVGRPTVLTAGCRLSATGAVRPYWPGQRLQIRVAGGHGATVTTTPRPTGGRWTLSTTEPCGRTLTVSARLSGTSHGTRYTSAASSPSAVART